MGVGSRLPGWRRRRGKNYASFIEQVEPELLRAGRLHRFAEPALLLGPPGVPPGVIAADALGYQVMAPATGEAEWVLRVERGYRLHPEAVLQFARAIACAGDATVITCDHDRLDAAGAGTRRRCGPGRHRTSRPRPAR